MEPIRYRDTPIPKRKPIDPPSPKRLSEIKKAEIAFIQSLLNESRPKK